MLNEIILFVVGVHLTVYAGRPFNTSRAFPFV